MPDNNTAGRGSPESRWKLRLVKYLLDQIIRVYRRADELLPSKAVGAMRADGSVNYYYLFKRLDWLLDGGELDEQLEKVDGLLVVFVRLFADRHPYLLVLPPVSRHGLAITTIPYIKEHDLIDAFKYWRKQIKPMPDSGNKEQREEEEEEADSDDHYGPSYAGLDRNSVWDPNAYQNGTSLTAEHLTQSTEWLRQTLIDDGLVHRTVLKPCEYHGQVIDGPEMILAQAKVHLDDPSDSEEDFVPGPQYADFDLEEYLDHIIIFGDYQDRVNLNDVLEVRELLAAQKKRMAESGEDGEDGEENETPSRRTPEQGSHRSSEATRSSARLPNGNEEGIQSDLRAVFHHTILNQQLIKRARQPGQPQTADWREPAYLVRMKNELRTTRDRIRKYSKLSQRLRRASRIVPRPCLRKMVRHLDQGLKDTQSTASKLQFRDDEFMWPNKSEFTPPRSQELMWLKYILRQPREPMRSVTSRRGRILATRIKGLLDSPDPTAVAGQESTDLQEFENALNIGLGGPVKKTTMDVSSSERRRMNMASLKLVKLKARKDRYLVQRMPLLYHPEDAIVWDRDALDSQGVPFARFVNYKERLPKFDNLRPVIEDNERTDLAEDRLRTANFYNCLAFRLGTTIKQLSATYVNDKEAVQEIENHMVGQFADDVLFRGGTIEPRHRNDSDEEPKRDEAAADRGWLRDQMIAELSETQDVQSRRADNQQNRRLPHPGGLWTFGHPDNKTRAPRFWDINRWPSKPREDGSMPDNRVNLKFKKPHKPNGAASTRPAGRTPANPSKKRGAENGDKGPRRKRPKKKTEQEQPESDREVDEEVLDD